MIENLDDMATMALKPDSSALVLLGDTTGEIGQSLYLKYIEGREEGAPPPVNLEAEKRTGDLVRALIRDGFTSTVHDVSDGGLYVAIAEMALAGNIGADVFLPETGNPVMWLFGEDQGRYVIATRNPDAILTMAEAAHIPAAIIGQTGGEVLTVEGEDPVRLEELRALHEGWLPGLMSQS